MVPSMRPYGKLGNLGNGSEFSETSEFSLCAYVTVEKLGTKKLGNLEEGSQVTWEFFNLVFNVKRLLFSRFSPYTKKFRSQCDVYTVG